MVFPLRHTEKWFDLLHDIFCCAEPGCNELNMWRLDGKEHKRNYNWLSTIKYKSIFDFLTIERFQPQPLPFSFLPQIWQVDKKAQVLPPLVPAESLIHVTPN